MSGVNSKSDRKSRQNNLLPIFKLNDDCFGRIFEWFSLYDLKKLRQTCKRMKKIADYYIKLNYRIGLKTDHMEKFDFLKMFLVLISSITWDSSMES